MRFVETPVFTSLLRGLFSAEKYRQLQIALLLRPEQGALIRGSGGLRKLRWGAAGRGKRGGVRLIYYWEPSEELFYMLYVLSQERARRSHPGPGANPAPAGRGGTQVKNADFAKLTRSIKQAGRIRRGRLAPSRVTTVAAADVRAIREELGKTQTEFALMIGVSPATLRNWEQGRRQPEGPARALLRVAARNPKAVAAALAS